MPFPMPSRILPVVLLALAPQALPAEPYAPDANEAQAALQAARHGADTARQRAERLERDAASAAAGARRSADQAAALAARIQQTEAEIAGKQADLRWIGQQHDRARTALAARQQPLVRLTAGLERLARWPLLLALFQPGPLHDVVHLRALLATMLPEVTRTTADLRSLLAWDRQLQDRANATIAALRAEQQALIRQKQALAGLEARQRLASGGAGDSAAREGERALALAERARDLAALGADLGKQGQLRDRLAALPGPVPRPAGIVAARASISEAASPAIPHMILPAQGRLSAGFGAALPGQERSQGLTITTAAGAQVIAPAAGHVAFAGPFRGYGEIVILDHGQGWISLVTGLARLDVKVGQDVLAGFRLGTAPTLASGHPEIRFELRHYGKAMNPLDFSY